MRRSHWHINFNKQIICRLGRVSSRRISMWNFFFEQDDCIIFLMCRVLSAATLIFQLAFRSLTNLWGLFLCQLTDVEIYRYPAYVYNKSIVDINSSSGGWCFIKSLWHKHWIKGRPARGPRDSARGPRDPGQHDPNDGNTMCNGIPVQKNWWKHCAHHQKIQIWNIRM